MDKTVRSILLNICHNYLKEFEVIMKQISELFNIDSIWSLRKIYFPNLIFEKENYKLIFHGIGVSILKNDFEIIDIENGGDIAVCGIDPWRLSEYIKSKENYINFFDNKENTIKYTKMY
ncbi:MAG TPA: hypothetical protein DC057_05255 [Spirochaetia bacterium]|nr:hypothetical protein [Spirochaetia bacterium]